MNFAGRVRRVLVFPAGTESGLEIHAALRNCKEVRLIGAGTDASNPARAVFADYQVLPHVAEPGWRERLIALCRRLEIDYIWPAHDDALLALVRTADIPAQVIASPLATCEIARSKRATYAHFADTLRVPTLFARDAGMRYPVFVKPDRGQGSQGAVRADDAAGLACALRGLADPLICEYFPGEEYTVDCFSDRERGLLFVGARQRLRVRNGIAVHTRTVDLPEARTIAELIAARLEFHGVWFFQLRRAANGELGLLEVAPRIAGSMAAHRVRGVNFPLLALFETERLPLTVLADPTHIELDRALGNRYVHRIAFSCAYIDLDDTLLLHGQVNLDVMSFVFQCINASKPVHLITRHGGDLDATLRQHRLAGLFDRIVHLRAGEPKSDHISEPDAILVDDSFAERREVAARRGIRSFDGGMLELLVRQAAPLEIFDDRS